jgi:hypothetical protein
LRRIRRRPSSAGSSPLTPVEWEPAHRKFPQQAPCRHRRATPSLAQSSRCRPSPQKAPQKILNVPCLLLNPLITNTCVSAIYNAIPHILPETGLDDGPPNRETLSISAGFTIQRPGGEGVRSRAAARQLDWIRLPEIKSKKEGGPAAADDATLAGVLGVAPRVIAAARRDLQEGLCLAQDDRGRVELASFRGRCL